MSGVEAASATSTTRYSSGEELSSPPRSISEPGSPAAQQLTNEYRNAQNNNPITINFGVEEPQKPLRKKPGRKPKTQPPPENGSSATNTDAPKTRKPRKPRDPNVGPVQRKKKSITADVEPSVRIASAGASRQLKAAEAASPMPDPGFQVPPNGTSSQFGKTEDIPKPPQVMSNSFFISAPAPVPTPTPAPAPAPAPPATIPQQQPLPQQAPIRTSGQNYDPIRSNFDSVRETVVTHNPFSSSQMSPRSTTLVNRASASPSISSLVDPPNQASTSPSLAAQSFFSHQMKMQNQIDNGSSVPPSPTINRLAQSPMVPNSQIPQPSMVSIEEQRQPQVQPEPQPCQPQTQPDQWIRAPAPAPTFTSLAAQPALPGHGHFSTIGSKAKNIGSTATSSAAQSPKPSKAIDVTPPPLPGSGAISMFGGATKDGTESRAPTIVLNITLNPSAPNQYVNFTRLAEEQYGWEALHPRLAAQRERLARVAAAGAALEKSSLNKESGDEMSLDLSEGEGSNVEMGGISDGRTGTDNGVKKPIRKRKMKEDDYDKDDGFVDDSELLWEEQAAASKDGFFVYSGPLVPDGEKPALERADGAPKRGRGRGRGGSTRGTASTRGGGTAGGGPGSRGGTTTRKPRITKADRARMEMEKKEREAMGLAAKPAYGAGILASAAMGGTPMVFNQ